MLSILYRWSCFGAALTFAALMLSCLTESLALGAAAYLMCFLFFPAAVVLRLLGGH